jgi:hypothetical protein
VQRLQQESRMMLCNSDFRASLDGPVVGCMPPVVDPHISPPHGPGGLQSRSAMPSSDGALGASNLARAMLGPDDPDQSLRSQWNAGMDQRRLSQGCGDSSMHGAGAPTFCPVANLLDECHCH